MEVKNRTLLFVEPDKELATEILNYFAPRNSVMIADSFKTAFQCMQLMRFDAIITEILLPDGTGLDIFGILKNYSIPVLIHSSIGNEDAMFESFSLGAIDYIVKPCSLRLLEIRLFLRLQSVKKQEKIYGGLKINVAGKTVSYNGTQLSLTSSEFNILYFLSQHAGTYYSADDLYEEIWQAQSLNTATVRKHISSMRRKLRDATGDKEYILTDFGKGYAFTEDYE